MKIGIDEVGRGAWAGPMLFCAVLLKKSVPGLKDSKLLSKAHREKLAKEIRLQADYIGFGWVSASEVDDLGLTKASELACRRAVKNAPKNIEIIIDGSINFLKNNSLAKNLVNGDETVPEISAASVLAKVERDKFMIAQAKIYPEYSFDTNVGYGTQKHMRAIEQNGLTPIHRWSYKPIKDFLDNYET